MFKRLRFKDECRRPCKLMMLVMLDIIFTIVLYYVIEYNVTNVSSKIVMVSILITFSVLFAMFLTLKFERKLSCIDPLTGVYNRRKLYIDLNKLIKNKNKFEIIFIDLNNFKEINDSYGHETGDEILGKFGERASNLGENITCYRTGGDEFILLANNTNCTIEKLNGFNFSHGISRFPEDTIGIENPNDIIDKLLSSADKKMYKRKREMKKV